RMICESERVGFDAAALAMVAAAAKGQVRDLNNHLDALVANGPLTTQSVAQTLDLSWAATALEIAILQSRGDYAESVRVARAWRAEPPFKARAIRDALVFVAHKRFASQTIDETQHAAFLGVDARVVTLCSDALAARAGTLDVSPLQV